jgi:serine/threonine protein kinase
VAGGGPALPGKTCEAGLARTADSILTTSGPCRRNARLHRSGGDHGQAVAAASDLYSLGCVVFKCVAGRPPFAHEHSSTRRRRMSRKTPATRVPTVRTRRSPSAGRSAGRWRSVRRIGRRPGGRAAASGGRLAVACAGPSAMKALFRPRLCQPRPCERYQLADAPTDVATIDPGGPVETRSQHRSAVRAERRARERRAVAAQEKAETRR